MPHYFLLLIMTICSLANGCKSQNVHQMNDNTGMHNEATRFKVVVINYYFGRMQFCTTITQDSLETLHDDLNGKQTKEARRLQTEETAKLKKFLSGFPLKDLEEKYINEKVEDGIQIGFDISVNDMQKRIYVSNEYQDDLGELVNVIRSMLKEDYIGYRKGFFR